MNSWWIYEKERFPLFTYSLLIAALVCAGAAVNQWQWQNAAPLVAVFCVVLMMFALLRIADEFKDNAEDCQFRPHRPVPRGLITLAQLKTLGLIFMVLQFGICALLGLDALAMLTVMWLYWALMSKEFFISQWLKHHPISYLLSHMLMMPCIAVFILIALITPHSHGFAQAIFVFTLWCAGLVLEIGRKLKQEHEEERGVDSYSKLWGLKTGTLIWFVLVNLMLSSLFLLIPAVYALVLLVGLSSISWFIVSLIWADKCKGKVLETVSGLLLLCHFVALSTLA